MLTCITSMTVGTRFCLRAMSSVTSTSLAMLDRASMPAFSNAELCGKRCSVAMISAQPASFRMIMAMDSRALTTFPAASVSGGASSSEAKLPMTSIASCNKLLK